MDKSKQLVVVVSRSHATGIGIIRALGLSGYTVDLVASVRLAGISEYASKSKFIRKYCEVVSPKFHFRDETDEALIEVLLGYEEESKQGLKPVLFSTDDYTASIIDQNRERLKHIFIMPEIVGGDEGAMTEVMDKTVQGNLARECGILTPLEWNYSLKERTLTIPEDMVYPCFVKPIESISGYKNEMAVCKNRTELKEHLLKLQKKNRNRSVIIQEFLKISREIDLTGACIDDEIIIPGIIKKTCVAKHEKGVTLSGMIYPFEELGDLCPKIVEMLRKFHYVGMFDMEFNVVGDKVYFNEVNFRSGGPNYSYFMSGANIPNIVVSELTTHTHDKEDEKIKKFGQNFIYEKVAWEDCVHGFMTREELELRLKQADFGLLNDERDPGPYDAFMNGLLAEEKANKKKEQQKKKAARREKRVAGIKKNLTKWKEKGFIYVQLRKLDSPWAKKLAKKYKKRRDERIKQKDLLQKQREGIPQYFPENAREKYNQRPRVLVAGRNYCSNLCIARALGEAGYSVEVMRVFQTAPGENEPLRTMRPDMFSKYIKAYYEVITNRKDENLVKELEKVANTKNKMLLVPGDDLVASVADLYYDRLKGKYLLPNVSDKQGEITYLMKKGVQKELAAKAGLPVLNSCIIEAKYGEFTIPDTVTYPCFIKAEVSRLAAKSRMHKCDTREELEGWMTVFSNNREISMVVEDYVEIKNEMSILGVSTKQGAIGPAAFVAVKGGSKEHKGVALTGRILDENALEPLRSQLIEFMGSLHFDGLYDIDLIEAADGTIYFVEINMRLGASGCAFKAAGVNLPGMFADYMIYHKPLEYTFDNSAVGKIFVSEKVLLDEFAGNRITEKEYKDLQKSADISFIYDEKDPGAYNEFKKRFKDAKKLSKTAATEVAHDESDDLATRLEAVENRAVKSVSKKLFLSEKATKEIMDAAKAAYGVSYFAYDKNDLWQLEPEEIPEYLDGLKSIEKQTKNSIQSAADKMGIRYDEAERVLAHLNKRYKISYELIDYCELWTVKPNDRSNFLEAFMKTRCTVSEYYLYKMKKMEPRRRRSLFLSNLSNQIASYYETKPMMQDVLNDTEKKYRYFMRYLKRPYFVTSRMNKNSFLQAFSESKHLVFRPFSNLNSFALIDVQPETLPMIYEKLASIESGIVEERLVQHSKFEEIAPNGNTILRFVTVSSFANPVLESGENISFAYAVLRTDIAETAKHQFYRGNLLALVNMETGTLRNAAVDFNMKKYRANPETKIRYVGFEIPMFGEAMEFVRNIIESKHIEGYYGFDILVTEDGPTLVDMVAQPSSVMCSLPYMLEKTGNKAQMKQYLWRVQGDDEQG